MERNSVQYYHLSEEIRDIMEGQSLSIEDLFKELREINEKIVKIQERIDKIEKNK